MIHELRTYTIRTQGGGVKELERRFKNGLDVRLKYSALGGFFHTLAGDLSQVVHIWPYEGMRNRAEARAAANRDESDRWPPGIAELFAKQEVEILLPAPFMRPLEPLEAGRLWELEWHDYAPGDVDEALEGIKASLPAREELSAIVGCWTVDVGPSLGRIYILSPYRDLEHRQQVIAELSKSGIGWPPRNGFQPASTGSKLLEPAVFSPLQ
jgi:hypothetical protein